MYKNDDSLLFIDNDVIKTTNGAKVETVWKGTGKPYDFEQINSTHVVIADYTQHCLRILNRATNHTEEFAGICGFGGYNDGHGLNARFNGTWGIVANKREPGKLLVADSLSSFLRSVDIKTRWVTTVTVSSELNNPRNLLWYEDTLLFTNSRCRYIAQVKWNDTGFAEVSILTGSPSRGEHVDGDFNAARFLCPREMIKLSERLLLVADAYDYRLRLLDMVHKRVLPVCGPTQNACNTSFSIPGGPYALLKFKEDVYVGVFKEIKKLSGMFNDNNKINEIGLT